MDLEDAMHAVAGGDTAALKIVYDELRIAVFTVALSILRSRPLAEDVLQETFIRVYQKAYTYQAGTNAKAWVVSIARNLAYDVLRRENKQRALAERESESTAEHAAADKMELTQALLRLEDLERQIVVMHTVGGFKHHEISKLLGIPAGTVRWKYRRSLLRLAELIGEG